MQGIVVIAFGKEYDKLAAYTVGYSQRFTDLPFCIMTNVRERHPKWGDEENVQFKYFDLKDNQNRMLKTTLVEHTPFDTTMYMDCDSLIQKIGISDVFNMEKDMVFNEYCSWSPSEKIPRLYADMFKKHDISRRVTIFSGVCFFFKQNDNVKAFFELWNRLWIEEGKGREMHCLAVAAIESGINCATFPGLFSPDMYNTSIVQHKNQGWNDRYGIPKITEDKSAMNKHSTHYQWNMVEFQ